MKNLKYQSTEAMEQADLYHSCSVIHGCFHYGVINLHIIEIAQ